MQVYLAADRFHFTHTPLNPKLGHITTRRVHYAKLIVLRNGSRTSYIPPSFKLLSGNVLEKAELCTIMNDHRIGVTSALYQSVLFKIIADI